MANEFDIPKVTPQQVRRIDTAVPRIEQAQKPDGDSFKDVLADSISEVQRLQNEADVTIRQLVSGELKDVTQAMVAIEKADVSFQTMMAVRNKIVSAYEEVMRMQV